MGDDYVEEVYSLETLFLKEDKKGGSSPLDQRGSGNLNKIVYRNDGKK